MDNTNGFTQDQLDLINEVHAELTADGMDDAAASDRINNAWNDDIGTVDDLRKALR